MSDRQENIPRTISHRFANNIVNIDGQSAVRARNYRKKLLHSYLQAELDSPILQQQVDTGPHQAQHWYLLFSYTPNQHYQFNLDRQRCRESINECTMFFSAKIK